MSLSVSSRSLVFATCVALGSYEAQALAAPDASRPRSAVILDSGERIEGEVVDLGTDSVVMALPSGERRTLPRAQIREIVALTARPQSDTVVLKDGTKVEGTILQQTPGQFVIIRLLDGSERTLSWDKVSESIVVPKANSEGPGTKTVVAAKADQNGAAITRTVDCKGAPGDPACHEQMSASIGKGGPQAAYVAEADCSEHPERESCKERTALDLSGAGVSASYTKETITKVKDPPSSAVNLAIDLGGGGIVGGSSGSSAAFLSADLKLRLFIGGRYPGAEGGSWHGLALEPSAAILAVFASAPSASSSDSYSSSYVPAGASSSKTSALLGVQIGGTVGYQYFHFSKQEAETPKQSGFGLLLGAFAGGTGIQSGSGSQSSLKWSPSYGPVIGISFPRYNPGTARYSAFSLTAMVLPTGEAGTLVAGSLGYLF